jgi:1-acyl-sn-glycerol-3-phosphate acyltransferase
VLDGFDARQAEPFAGFDANVAERFYDKVAALARRLRVEVEGVEHVPPGRALIVANHAFGFDVAFAMEAVWREQRRTVWSLGEHAWWVFPFLRRLAAGVGVVDGTRDNVDTLLKAEQLVLVMPGGLREAMKPHVLSYRLLWGHRYGFVRAAIANRTPIVPLACVGADDVFDLVGDAFERGRRWTGMRFPIPRPSWGLPIPHRVALRYVFGEPVMPLEHACSDDETSVKRLRHEVEGALQELLDEELARRAGVSVHGDTDVRV